MLFSIPTSYDQTILNKPNLSFGLSRAILLITTINLVVSLGTNFFRGFCRVWQWRIRILYRRCDFFNSRRNLCGCLLYELGCGDFRQVLQKGLVHKMVSDTSKMNSLYQICSKILHGRKVIILGEKNRKRVGQAGIRTHNLPIRRWRC